MLDLRQCFPFLSAKALRSTPAPKLPDKTATLALSEPSNDKNALYSSFAVGPSTALRCSGRFIDIVHTAYSLRQ